MPGENISRVLAIERPDRMLVTRPSREGFEQLQETHDRATIDDVLAFFRRYSDGWIVFSGMGGEYEFYFYRNDHVMLRAGISDSSKWSRGEATLNVFDHRRQVAATDVAALASRFNLPWPPTHLR